MNAMGAPHRQQDAACEDRQGDAEREPCRHFLDVEQARHQHLAADEDQDQRQGRRQVAEAFEQRYEGEIKRTQADVFSTISVSLGLSPDQAEYFHDILKNAITFFDETMELKLKNSDS